VLLSNPSIIDEESLAEAIRNSKLTPRIQFSRSSAYDKEILHQVNHACQRFGCQIHIRFFGHYSEVFNCAVLKSIPAVKSLGLDCLASVENIEELADLPDLESLTLGVFELRMPKILEISSLKRLRKLILVDTRDNKIDLKALAGFRRLEELSIGGHSTNIDVLGEIQTIRSLSLNQMRRGIDLGFVGAMKSLRSLSLALGGRHGTDEFASQFVERLSILRVRGFEHLNLNSFSSLQHLHVEDQLKLTSIDLAPASDSLRSMKIWNCKNLAAINGLKILRKLDYLWLGKTTLDPDKVLADLPPNLRSASLAGYGARRDLILSERLRAGGYIEADYLTMPGNEYS